MRPTRWAVTLTLSVLTAICDTSQLLAYSGHFFRKQSRVLFDAKLFLFAKCARAYETWKQWQWIRRKLCRKHKIWGESWLYLRPYLKVFSVFNVLQTGRVFLLEIDLEIVKFIKKKIYERFFGKCENCRHGPNYVQKLSPKQLDAS